MARSPLGRSARAKVVGLLVAATLALSTACSGPGPSVTDAGQGASVTDAGPGSSVTDAVPSSSAADAPPGEAPAAFGDGECGALLQFAFGKAALQLAPLTGGRSLTDSDVTSTFEPLQPFRGRFSDEMHAILDAYYDTFVKAIGKDGAVASEIFDELDATDDAFEVQFEAICDEA